jgi:hypothetical protein
MEPELAVTTTAYVPVGVPLADPGVGVGVGEGKGVGVGAGLEELAAFPPQPIAMAPKRISAGAKAGLQASRRPREDSNLF